MARFHCELVNKNVILLFFFPKTFLYRWILPIFVFPQLFFDTFFVWLFPPSRRELGQKTCRNTRPCPKFVRRAIIKYFTWLAGFHEKSNIHMFLYLIRAIVEMHMLFKLYRPCEKKESFNFESVLRNAVRVFQQCKVCFLMFWLIFCLFVFLSCTYIYIYNEKPINV